jgi:hypothetical protein
VEVEFGISIVVELSPHAMIVGARTVMRVSVIVAPGVAGDAVRWNGVGADFRSGGGLKIAGNIKSSQ